MTHKCPYCEKEAKPRGLKNHVRLSSGNGHGDKGEVPDDYAVPDAGDEPADEPATDADEPAESVDADSGPSPGRDAAEVTADDLTTTDAPEASDGPTEASDDGDDFPFDPDAEGAVRLDGDETVYVRVDGDIVEASPSDGDYLLITDAGPILWDSETDERFEVVTE